MENLLNLGLATSPLNFKQILISIAFALILSLVVAVVYKNTHKGLSYSQSFTFTLVLIGTLIAVIMMVIGNSLAMAFGAFGAFSLIRFRTAIKDTKDIAFILLVVAIGLASGTGNYLIALITTVVAVSAIYLMTRFNFGSIRKYDYLLSFSVRASQFSNDLVQPLFKNYLLYNNLLNVVARDKGEVLDYSFNVKFIKTSEIKEFIGDLNKIEGVFDVEILSAKNDIEY
ncbi:MAG: DUF4956 domain-containing protein [Candidatus Komeilibacteria bacterium]|nr:DUF4956 domain-containing protein [Candidatus Komeilibacteria bacterium]